MKFDEFLVRSAVCRRHLCRSVKICGLFRPALDPRAHRILMWKALWRQDLGGRASFFLFRLSFFPVFR